MKNGISKTAAKALTKSPQRSTAKRARAKTIATSERTIRYLSIVIEPNDDGYLARCAGIQGAFAEGDTIEDAIFNCVDVVKMISGYRKGTLRAMIRDMGIGVDTFMEAK